MDHALMFVVVDRACPDSPGPVHVLGRVACCGLGASMGLVLCVGSSSWASSCCVWAYFWAAVG
ncbi:hypothetical protein COCNU_scaffold023282G000020 [Cocos nucifera]|nr:hypothetical protein [Cocos nucifera]